MVWSHAVGHNGTVTGLEFDANYAKQAREAWAANGIKNASVIVGDALQTYAAPFPFPYPSPFPPC